MTTVKRDYNIVTDSIKSFTIKDLYNTDCSKASEMMKHCDIMLDIRSRIEQNGIQVSNDQFIGALETSVPNDYKQLVMMMHMTID